ncbi:MAG: flagellin [Nitrospinota bacterium]
MTFRISNNVASLRVSRFLSAANTDLGKSLERVSSGLRINRASDDAAGLAVSQTLRSSIASFKVAARNTTEATSLVQVAEGAVNEISNILVRLKELATQAASSNAGTDRDKIDAEAQKLINEIDRISNATEYDGTKLLKGTFGNTATTDAASGIQTSSFDVSGADAAVYTLVDPAGDTLSLGNGTTTQTVTLSGTGPQTVNFTDFGIKFDLDTGYTTDVGLNGKKITVVQGTGGSFQVGDKNDANNRIAFNIANFKTAKLKNGNALTVNLTTQSGAQTALADVDTSINYVNLKRGDLGGVLNRLQFASADIGSKVENLTAANSAIRDADIAAEISAFTKNQILLRASTAILAQANQVSALALKLLP